MLHYCKWFWFATVLSTCFYYGSFSASAISASAEAKKEDFQNSGISTLSNNFLQATQPHRHSAFNNTTSAQLENPGTPFSYSLEMDENQRIENSTNSSSSNTSPHPQIQSLTSNVTIVQLKTSLKPTISSVTIDENKMYEKASTSTSPITSLQSTQLETQALKTNAMIIKLQKVRKPFNSSMEADEIQMLGNSLLAIARRELADCDLVIALGPGFHSMQILSQLVELPHRRQVLIIASGTDLNNIHWKSTECRAYFFLWVETELLKTFTEVQVDDWDYGGRYVFVGPTLEQLNVLVASQKGKKTEHIVGIIQSQNRRQQWQIYMNLLYWGPGVERINTWKKNRFTGERNLFPDKISDLRGATLKAVAFVFAPSIMYFRDENGVVLYPYGIDVAIVNTLSAAVNFTVKYQEPPNDEKWGEKTERGWTGMMGLMKRDEADIGIADLFVSVTRTPVLDYTMPFDNEVGGDCLIELSFIIILFSAMPSKIDELRLVDNGASITKMAGPDLPIPPLDLDIDSTFLLTGWTSSLLSHAGWQRFVSK
ncbi:hypothetical protein SK128_010416 [Halocaridina rubra]|uniref:Ionotropic glutamate receptor L-glutamate and glycine-binding domain-containing protein n=1 Tax=Halocaridina rubra TaxID=373956 RepID=A0AAN9A147_HALRR